LVYFTISIIFVYFVVFTSCIWLLCYY